MRSHLPQTDSHFIEAAGSDPAAHPPFVPAANEAMRDELRAQALRAAAAKPSAAPPTVVLLHSSASSARQWQALREALQPDFRVLAVDLHGHGARPPWPADAPFALADDAALVEPLLRYAPVHLVGHSYGAAVALKAAALYPRRVLGVVAYEPVLFALLRDDAAPSEPLRAVVTAAEGVSDALRRGDEHAAAHRFVDFWSGASAWQALDAVRQQAIAARMPSVLRHFDALLGESLVAELAALAMPMLFLTGTETLPAMRRIGELLRAALPRAQHELVAGMNHMSPVTQPAAINARIEQFLRAQFRRRAALRPQAEFI